MHRKNAGKLEVAQGRKTYIYKLRTHPRSSAFVTRTVSEQCLQHAFPTLCRCDCFRALSRIQRCSTSRRRTILNRPHKSMRKTARDNPLLLSRRLHGAHFNSETYRVNRRTNQVIPRAVSSSRLGWMCRRLCRPHVRLPRTTQVYRKRNGSVQKQFPTSENKEPPNRSLYRSTTF